MFELDFQKQFKISEVFGHVFPLLKLPDFNHPKVLNDNLGLAQLADTGNLRYFSFPLFFDEQNL